MTNAHPQRDCGEIYVREVGFVIEAWRHAALGDANFGLLLREFRKQCGCGAEEVFESYFLFLKALGRASRKRLCVGHPGCPGMTRDEIQVLSMLAAAQSGHWVLFDAHLCWLTANGPRAAIATAAMVLADALTACRIDMSDRLYIQPPTSGTAAGGPVPVSQLH